jgi:hypothetical protein
MLPENLLLKLQVSVKSQCQHDDSLCHQLHFNADMENAQSIIDHSNEQGSEQNGEPIRRRLTNIHLSLERMPVYVKFGAQVPVYPQNVQCTDEMDLTETIKVVLTTNSRDYELLA